MSNKNMKEVDLLGRDSDKLLYRNRGVSSDVSISISTDSFEYIEFSIQYDELALNKAVFARNWGTACSFLVPVVTPLLPYLDIQENNGAEPALQAGIYLIREAKAALRTGKADKDKLNAQYMKANTILEAVGKAKWFSGADTARLYAILCLVYSGGIEKASRRLEAVRVPEPGDVPFGLYWFVTGHLLLAKGEIRPAMEAAVKSLVFESKDTDSYPDALLLSARCYEELLEPHRARDVYFEVVRLFVNTEWEDIARNRLETLMRSDSTRVPEPSPIENVFFGTDENMNAKADSLLGLSGSVTNPPTGANPGGKPPEKKEKNKTTTKGDKTQ